MPVRTLALFAQRIGKLFASATTWSRQIRQRGWRRPRIRQYPAKPKVGVRGGELWRPAATEYRQSQRIAQSRSRGSTPEPRKRDPGFPPASQTVNVRSATAATGGVRTNASRSVRHSLSVWSRVSRPQLIAAAYASRIAIGNVDREVCLAWAQKLHDASLHRPRKAACGVS